MSQISLTSTFQSVFPARLFGGTRSLAEARRPRAGTQRTERTAVVRPPSPGSRGSAHTALTRAQAQIFLALR